MKRLPQGDPDDAPDPRTDASKDQLDPYWDALRREHYRFEPARRWAQAHRPKPAPSMRERLQRLAPAMVWPRLALAGLFVGLGVGAYAIPVVQQDPVGQLLVWTVEMPAGEALQALPDFPWLDRRQLSAIETYGRTTFAYVDTDASEREAVAWMQAIRASTPVSSFWYRPLTEPVRRPLALAALRWMRLDVGGKHVPTEQIERRIEDQLEALGAYGITAEVRRDADGGLSIALDAPGPRQLGPEGMRALERFLQEYRRPQAPPPATPDSGPARGPSVR
ncbi:MAG TPA: hypothetical protein VD948_06155 [Rhodothermales bacterium]|nr:hypothetical protein [Rhodothermales bacterium]